MYPHVFVLLCIEARGCFRISASSQGIAESQEGRNQKGETVFEKYKPASSTILLPALPASVLSPAGVGCCRRTRAWPIRAKLREKEA